MNITRKLFVAYKNGNCRKIEQLFSIIYDEYADLVFVLISKYIKRYEDIEELTDDVFIQLFNHLENLNPDKDIKYYLMTSAKNASINFMKKNNRFMELDNNVINDFGTNDLHFSLFIEEWEAVLSKNEIDLILSHDLDGNSLRELAINNNQSPNTTKSIYRRAIKKLQNFYKEKGHEKNK